MPCRHIAAVVINSFTEILKETRMGAPVGVAMKVNSYILFDQGFYAVEKINHTPIVGRPGNVKGNNMKMVCVGFAHKSADKPAFDLRDIGLKNPAITTGQELHIFDLGRQQQNISPFHELFFRTN